MGHHTFDPAEAEKLEDPAARYRYVSREELLWGLDPEGTETVADLGSGTGFYTDDVAPHVDRAYAVDVQDEMHGHYREKGVPANVELVTASVDDLPFDDDHLDGAVSTMTYHEFASDRAIAELARVLRPDGRLVVADWSKAGIAEDGPPLSERYAAEDAAAAFRNAGFELELVASRPETFLVVGVRER